MIQKACKEDLAEGLLPVTWAASYGHVNEWGIDYLRSARSRNELFVGAVTTTIRALVMRNRCGTLSPLFRQWIVWKEGPNILEFNWITDASLCLKERLERLEWYYGGKLQRLSNLADSSGRLAREVEPWGVRMHSPGLVAIGALALRAQLMSDVFSFPRALGNDPTLWVPRQSMKVEVQPQYLVEPFLNWVISGGGSLKSPAFLQLKELCHTHFGIPPWKVFFAAGCRAAIMVSDFGKKPQALRELFALVKRFYERPRYMSGFGPQTLDSCLSEQEQLLFKDTVPWWFMDLNEFEVPSMVGCFITARRVDTHHAASPTYVPALELGFRLYTCGECRQKLPPVVATPAAEILPTMDVLVEVKPELEALLIEIETPTAS